MRWTINCLLLTTIAVISATEESTNENDTRLKRDLSYIKSLVSTKIFGVEDAESPKIAVRQPGNYRLFRIPGFDKILVKAVPKVPGQTVLDVPESDSVDVHPSVAIVNSYLGTERLNDTLLALQGMKNLLQSGILESQGDITNAAFYEQGSYPSIMVDSGKIAVGDAQKTVALKKADLLEPIFPAVEGYRPVQITRLPDVPLPTKYSYKQANGGGVTSYTANDNQHVLVTESKRPIPLPHYVTYRMQEAMGAHRVPSPPLTPFVAANIKASPLPVPVYNAPTIQYASVPRKAMQISSGYDYSHVQPPVVQLPALPAKVAPLNTPSGYSYNQVRHDGSVITYSGDGLITERKGERPGVVIAETVQPAPIPVFLTNRIEKAAAAAMAVRIPNAIPHSLYESSVPVYRKSYPAIVEDRPTYFYNDHASFLPYEINRPFYREDVNVNFAQHKNPHPAPAPNVPSQYSYKHVHADGTVSTYSDSGVYEQQVNKEVGPAYEKVEKFYPANYYNNGIHQTHLVKDVICDEPPHLHAHNGVIVHGNPQPAFNFGSKYGGYSYNTVLGGASQTTYSGSGHAYQHNPENFSGPNPNSPVMVPELVSPEEFFDGDFKGPEKVMFAEPVVSKYVYKQINHNHPNEFEGDVVAALNGDVNVQLGAMPVQAVTPRPHVRRPAQPPMPMASAEPHPGQNGFVYVPPTSVRHPPPTRKPVEPESEKAQSGFSYKQVTSSSPKVSSTVNSVTSAPVVKIVKSSSSSSSYRRPVSSTPRSRPSVRVTTPSVPVTSAPTTQFSLSANPIVVLPEEEQTFSFKQNRADGSSITVVGNKENVSVVEENRNGAQRGDIPDTSY